MKTIGAQELTEHINEILRMVEEESETIEVTKRGEVIALLVPVHKPQQLTKRDLRAFWAEIDQVAAEIGSYLPGTVNADDIMRDVRRDL